MKLETLSYQADQGWSTGDFPSLDSPQTLVVAFGASCYAQNQAPLEALRAAYPQACVIGCSTAGEIQQTRVNDDSLSVAILRFEATRLAQATAPIPSMADSYTAGRALASALWAPELRGVFVLSDGIHVNGTELVRGMNEVLSGDVVVTGGLAGDGEAFNRTWILDQNGLHDSVVSGIAFYGDRVRLHHGSKGGWDIFGPERRVTRSEGNVLYELDGKPALALYKRYLGERAAGLPATALLFPLALRAREGETKQIVRTVLAVDETSQSMTFAGDVPQGYRAQLMKANFDRLIDGAGEAAQMSLPAYTYNGPALSLAISCVGRRLVLGERTEEELEATLDVLPPGTRQIGFYSYGEISPYAAGTCDLHNQTMTLTMIAEE